MSDETKEVEITLDDAPITKDALDEAMKQAKTAGKMIKEVSANKFVTLTQLYD